MIDPQTVMVGIPCHDGKLMTELAGMLVQNRDLYGSITMPTECSHPSLVRNIMADTFLRSPFQWFIGIDSDIVPMRSDFLLLLQERDDSREYFGADDPASGLTDASRAPLPSRIDAATESGTRTMADVLVCAEYAYKREPFEPVQFGGGFYRVHRSVFSILQDLKHADNGRVEVDQHALGQLLERIVAGGANDTEARRLAHSVRESSTRQAGTPRLWQTTHNGRLFHDFFPSGPLLSLHVPAGEWKGEDHGFWTLCMLAGLVPRIETRTRLIHIGRKGYPYEGPDGGGGQ